MSERVSEWIVCQLSSLLELQHGYQFRTPDFCDTGIKVVKIGQVIGQGKLDLTNCDYVSEELAEQKKEFLLSSGDILMSLTGNIGRVGVVPDIDFPLIQNYRVGKFVPNFERVERMFLSHLLGSEFVTKQMDINSNTTAQANFGKADIDKVTVDIPPLPEQKKIASILTSVDEVIEKTQSQIDKLQNLKKATMNELLTRGIGHTEFKNNLCVKEFSKLSAGGTPSTIKPEYWEGGTIPWLSSGEVNRGRIKHADGNITELGFRNSAARVFPTKTILIALAGQGKTRGTVAITEIETTTNQSIAGLIVDQNKCVPDFLYFNLQSRYEELRSISGGAGRAGLNLQILGDVEVMLPSFAEQQKIVSILTSIDKVIEQTQSQLEQTQALKKSLMQDLLTGKVRVSVN